MRGLVVVVLFGACGSSPPAPSAPLSSSATIVVLDRAPADAVALDVLAVRWSCRIVHAHGIETDELRVPVGRAIKLHVWTPEPPGIGAGKAVSLVGTTLTKAIEKDAPVDVVFRIDRPGVYEWKCPTITPPPSTGGAAPSPEMLASENPIKPLHAIPAADYDAFIAENDPAVPANAERVGKTLYEKKGCVSCHTLDGTNRIGPSWRGIWGTTVTASDGTTRTVDERFVEESLLAPTAFLLQGYPPSMPSFDGQLQPREIAALTAFIKSLK